MGPVRRVQTFEVSLKAFIVDGPRALFVRESDTGYWELPGGRIDMGEEWMSHAETLAREIGEELGPAIVIDVSEEAITWVRQRPIDGVFQFIVGRRCRLVSGTPTLSSEHDRFAWVEHDAARALQFPPSSGYPAAVARLYGRGAEHA